MLWNREQELAIIESQPGWIQVNEKIEQLKEQYKYWNNKINQDSSNFVVKKVSALEIELQFFENILQVWIDNYNRMDRLAKGIQEQVKAANEGERLLMLIEDYRAAYSFEHKENRILSETFIKLAKEKGLPKAEKIKEVLNDLSVNSRDFMKYLRDRQKQIMNEQTT